MVASPVARLNFPIRFIATGSAYSFADWQNQRVPPGTASNDQWPGRGFVLGQPDASRKIPLTIRQIFCIGTDYPAAVTSDRQTLIIGDSGTIGSYLG